MNSVILIWIFDIASNWYLNNTSKNDTISINLFLCNDVFLKVLF